MSQKEVTFTSGALDRLDRSPFRANFSASYRVSDSGGHGGQAHRGYRADHPPGGDRRHQPGDGWLRHRGRAGHAAHGAREPEQAQLHQGDAFCSRTPLVALELDTKAKEYLSKRREMRRDAELARGSTDLTKATANAHHWEQA